MRLSGIEQSPGGSAVRVAGAVIFTIVAGIGSDASARSATVTKAYATASAQDVSAQPQKPAKLRYFGGPKSAMYSE